MSPAKITTLEVDAPPSSDPKDDDLPPLPAPPVTDAMYYGLVGDVMRAASAGTEVNPAAAGIAFASFAAVALGRHRYVQIGNSRHHARLYTMHVGRSSIAGKGMALELTRRIRRECELNKDPRWDLATGNFHDGGLSSREGLAWLIRDASDIKDKDGESVDLGISDKRLFIVEEEFANVLRQQGRDGNTLSSAIRSAWDGHDIAPATKGSRTRASKPHIGLHACITPTELGSVMAKNDLSNGFANRFLCCWAERRGVIAFPPPTPTAFVEQAARRLTSAVIAAEVEGGMAVSDAAKARFARFYRDHRRGFGMSMLIRGLLERQPPYAWRLALLFALLDQANEISDAHMTAALAWLAYCRDSTTLIFSTATMEAEAEKAAELGQRIIAEIAKAGGSMDREPLRVALGKPDKHEFNEALGLRIDAGEIAQEIIPREGGGHPQRRYTLQHAPRLGRLARLGSASGLQGEAAHAASEFEGTKSPPSRQPARLAET